MKVANSGWSTARHPGKEFLGWRDAKTRSETTIPLGAELKLRAGREGPSSGASCRREGTVNKAHRLVLQPAVVCLRPPRMKKS